MYLNSDNVGINLMNFINFILIADHIFLYYSEFTFRVLVLICCSHLKKFRKLKQ